MVENVHRRHEPYYKLKGYLAENGISQTEVAQLLGITKNAFNQRINGTGGDFSLKEVRKICVALNISADDFFIDHKVSIKKLKT